MIGIYKIVSPSGNLNISPSLITNSLKKKYKISKWNFSYYE